MNRRALIAALGSAAAWPLAARAQQTDRVRRIGVLMHVTENDPDGQARLTAFVERLKELGWSEGRNLRFDIRWGPNDPDRAEIGPDIETGPTIDRWRRWLTSRLSCSHRHRLLALHLTCQQSRSRA